MNTVILVAALWSVSATGDVDAALSEAETLAIREESEAAIAAYETILKEGKQAPGLRYNLGTLYLEQGDLGRSVLHLRAALRENPADSDAKHNLEVALSGRTDQLLGVGPGLPWWQIISQQTRPIIAQLAFLLPFALLLLMIGSWPWVPRLRWRYAVLSALCGCFALGSVLLLSKVMDDRQVLAVVLEETSALKGPDAAAAVAFQAHPGLSGTVQRTEKAFVRVRLDNGVDAWFARDRLGFVD